MSVIARTRRHMSDLRLSVKLGSAFALIVSVSIVMCYFGYKGATRMALFNSAAQSLFVHDLTGISSIKEAAIFQLKSTRVLRDMLLASSDKDSITDLSQTLDEFQASVKENLKAAGESFEDKASKQKVNEILESLTVFQDQSAQVVTAANAGNMVAEKAALKETNTVANSINLAIAEVCRIREDAAKGSRVEAQSTYKRLRTLLLALACGVVLLGLICAVATIRAVTRPLDLMMEVLQAVAKGDLTPRLANQSRDEMGQMSGALNQALESIRCALLEVNETTGALFSVSRELTGAAGVLEQGSKDQSTDLEHTSATLEQITSAARQTAENAANATELSSGASSAGGTKMEQVNAVEAMAEIKKSSAKISEIVSTVNSIAFQTNILALNAAVEAAHAGEGGRGFSVVASEVRSLAQRSSDSAKQIGELIQESMAKVGKGSELVNRVTQLVGQIATASAEQSVGIAQVNTAITAMDSVTKNNLLQAGKLTDSAGSLATQAAQLRQMLARFQLTPATE